MELKELSVVPLTEFLFPSTYFYESLSVRTSRRANNGNRLDVKFCLFVE